MSGKLGMRKGLKKPKVEKGVQSDEGRIKDVLKQVMAKMKMPKIPRVRKYNRKIAK